jgi:hypothetical protein
MSMHGSEKDSARGTGIDLLAIDGHHPFITRVERNLENFLEIVLNSRPNILIARKGQILLQGRLGKS